MRDYFVYKQEFMYITILLTWVFPAQKWQPEKYTELTNGLEGVYIFL